MKSENEQDRMAKLRQRAEAALRGQPVDLVGMPPKEIEDLLHELQVHQVELKMQNEELRQAQQALEASRDQYVDLYHFAPAGYCTLDRNGIILEANQMLSEMLGVPTQEMLGNRLAKYILAEDRDAYHLHWRQAVATNARQIDKIRLSGQSEKPLHARLISVPNHLIPEHLRVMLVDISDLEETREALQASEERLRLTDALRQSEERLQLATTAANIGIWDWDLTNDRLTSNDRHKILLGIPADAALSFEMLLTVIHEKDREKKLQFVEGLKNSQEIIECEYRVYGPDGGTRWILDRGRSYWDENGSPVRMAGITMDVSRQKEHEAQLQAYAADLMNLNRELENYAMIASHDLQEPLRKIRQFGERLTARVDASESLDRDGRMYIERMQNAAERMQNMIDNFLAYSRVTNKPNPFHQVDLSKVLNEALSDLEIRLDRSSAKVQMEVSGTVPGDETQLRQLFSNIISNAIKFTKPGVAPKVRISTHTRYDEDGKEWIDLLFEDNGIGFDTAYLSEMFKPFHRLVGRSEYEGSGMGLAICEKIVEHHHGEIMARSTPDQGSTFIVTLPVSL
jgi:PAS domain S-box-containing protein